MCRFICGLPLTEKIFALLIFAVAGTTLGPRVLAGQASADTGTVGSGPSIAHRIAEPVTLDGASRESFWSTVAPVPLTMYTPTHRGVLTERTEIRIAYDARYLYVSGRFFDSTPEGIRVNSLYRDRTSGDDTFGLVIDPFDDNDIGLWFWTTPAGIRGDATINRDAQGATNTDWNTHWDVATIQTEEGWFAEMRIPFSSLGFQANGNRIAMAITAYRYIARKNERQVFPDIAPEFNFLRPSLAHAVELRDIDVHRPAYLTPYVLSGLAQNAELDATATRYRLDRDVRREIGGDVRYNLTNNLTLDLTVNTDFAQVEADDEQVNLTRFPLFFPEKRQFFQERSGIFDFPTGGSTRLFHSRQIGLTDGQPTRILGGARVVGRLSDWDVGFLSMQTAAEGDQPAEYFGVARARRRVLNPHSTAGAMVTTRLGFDGTHNVAYGLDGSFRVTGDEYLTVRLAQTFDDRIMDDRGLRFLPSGLMRVTWNRARARGFTYFFSALFSGEDYQPDVGFVTRRNFSDLFYYLAYFHYPQGNGPLRRIDLFQLFGSFTLRNEDGSIESAMVEHDFDLQWKSGAGLGLDLELHHEDLREPLAFTDDAIVPVGSHTFPRFEGDYNTAPGDLFRAGFNWGVGGFYDGWRANIAVGPQWNVSRFLELNGRYQLDVVRFPDRDQGFDAHLLRLRTRAALDTKLSVNAFVQFSNVSHLAAANIRIRYNFREGNDFWIVYNEGMNLDRNRVDPALPRTDRRAVLLKYTYTFTR